MPTDLGERFARSLVAVQDAGALRALLTPKVDFRGLTPGRYWESDEAHVVVRRDDDLLHHGGHILAEVGRRPDSEGAPTYDSRSCILPASTAEMMVEAMGQSDCRHWRLSR